MNSLEQIGFSYRGWTLRNISWKLLGSLGNTQIKRYKDETRTWQNNGVSLLRVLFYTNRVFAVSSLIGSPLLHPLFKITHPCFPICICTVLISSRNKKVIPLQMERGQLRVFASCLWSKKTYCTYGLTKQLYIIWLSLCRYFPHYAPILLFKNWKQVIAKNENFFLI